MTPAQSILIKYWGYTHFRPLQEEIIQAVADGRDALALMPTGGGKSICFQVPALMNDGICIVISPLIALMKDQVENLLQKEIKAAAVFSGMHSSEIDRVLDNCIYGEYKFLYLSPERLMNEMVQLRLSKMKVNLLAVDEAHCISQWGYDFRPYYLRIAEIRKIIPGAPLLALTASATKEVQQDIFQKLEMKNAKFFQKSFARKNLSYLVFEDEDKLHRMLDIFKKVNGSGIIYVRNRKKTKEYADYLNRNGISATFYHAGLPYDERNKKQDEWKRNKIRVIAATNAFGMGIDKPDVRVVVHLDTPESLEAYYQEAGRAGRDDKNAYAVLFHSKADVLQMQKQFEASFPESEKIKLVYHALGNFLNIAIGSGAGISHDFDITQFSKAYNFNPLEVYNSLKILQDEGFISVTDELYMPSRIRIILNNKELYKFQVEQKQFDSFIKTILRSYGGLFDEFVKIDEAGIASKAGIKTEETIRTLFYLHKLKLLHYIPRTDKPQLTFLTARLAANNISFNHASLLFRKKRFKERMQAVIYYAETKSVCRNKILLGYFGEHTDVRCGTCDYCRQRNKIDLNDIEFNAFTQKVKLALSVRPRLLSDLVHEVHAANNDKLIKAIQLMLDNNLIVKTANEELAWKH